MSIELTLFVDKEMQKVVFAECGSDFIDVLFSFLTLPLGTIVRLYNKQSGLGFMDKLYESVENLNANKHLQTDSCKTMLLQPRSIATSKCEGLAVNICDELNLSPRKIFLCSNWECTCRNFPHYSSVSGVVCTCGRIMDKVLTRPKTEKVKGGGVFLDRAELVQFMVSDDLHVFAVSSISVAFPLLEKYGFKDPTNLEDRKIHVDKTQILQLLKRSLLSKTPLTDVFLGKSVNNATANIATTFTTKIKTESDEAPIKQKRNDANESAFTTKVKILECSKVRFVEAGNDFVDLAFSFLTFPLGQAISLMGESCSNSMLRCIHHIYQSIHDLNAEIMPVECKEMLLHTKLPSHFSCGNQLLKVDEIEPRNYDVKCCANCFNDRKLKCSHLHAPPSVKHTELNTKLAEVASENGGGFTRTNAKFMVTSDMMVKPISIVSTIQLFKDLGASLNSLKERVVTIDETKALSFLEACLTSRTGIIDSLLK